MYTAYFHTKKQKLTKIKFLFKFFLKPCRNLMFFGPTKGGTPKTFNGFQGLTYTWIFDTIKRKMGKIKFLFKFFLKQCRNLMFFGPKKGGNPTKAFLRWNFFPTLESGSFGPRWRGNSSTWNLFVPLILLPAKTIFFEIWCCAMF